MSRTLSSASLAAVLAQETAEVFIRLITIDHPDLAAPIRVSSDAVDTVSNGNTYTAFPFELQLPDDSGDRPQTARLTIDNVSREIVQAIRSIQSPPSVTIEIVRAADPDTIEVSYTGFALRNVRYDAMVVSGDLTVDDFTTEPYPAGRFVPSLFPALF